MVKMNIYYNNIGVPLVEIDGKVYRFLADDHNIIISELSLNKEYIEEIRKNLIDSINTLENSLNSINYDITNDSVKSNYYIYSRILELIKCFEILHEAYSMSLMLSVEKPYDSWVWNGEKLEWEAPTSYPSVIGDNIYIWNEHELGWEPLAVSPYPSWVWNNNLLEWEPPIKYPLDAGPNDFIWSEDLSRWVANV